MKQKELSLATLCIAREFVSNDGEIRVTFDLDRGIECGGDGLAISFHDELICRVDAVSGLIVGDSQDQRVVQASRALHDGSATGTPAEDGNIPRFTRGDIHFRSHFVRVAYHHKVGWRLPEA